MSNSRPRILVFIPAYRCERQISRVIEQFDERVQALVDTILVVDNRSPDDTLRVAVEAAKRGISQCDFIAWVNADNYGLGGSHKVAFRWAQQNGFDYLVVLHGDDQADIRDLVPRIEEGLRDDLDCLLGARFMRGSRLEGYSAFRAFGNRVYNLLFSLATFRRIRDLGSGLNVYRLAAFSDAHYERFPDDLTFNYAMLLASHHRGQFVEFFPITWREEDQVSNVRLFRQAWRVLGILAGYFVGRGSFLARDMRATRFPSYSGSVQYMQRGRARGSA